MVAPGHRPSDASQAVAGMVDEVLRTSMSSRYQTLGDTHHPRVISDSDSGGFQ